MTDATAQAAMIDALFNKIGDAIWDSAGEGTFSYGSNASAIVSDMAKASAAAVLELMRPKPLVWVADPRQDYKRLIASAHGFTYHVDTSYSGPEAWLWIYENGNSVTKRTEKPQPNEAAAQAAAQTHADAAHWASTGLGDLIAATKQGDRA
jgi:hypothetical protein